MANEALAIAIVIIGAYLLGSIPFPYIIGRLKKGIDIRQVGSRNMGAMNTFYNVGIASGFLALNFAVLQIYVLGCRQGSRRFCPRPVAVGF